MKQESSNICRYNFYLFPVVFLYLFIDTLGALEIKRNINFTVILYTSFWGILWIISWYSGFFLNPFLFSPSPPLPLSLWNILLVRSFSDTPTRPWRRDCLHCFLPIYYLTRILSDILRDTCFILDNNFTIFLSHQVDVTIENDLFTDYCLLGRFLSKWKKKMDHGE